MTGPELRTALPGDAEALDHMLRALAAGDGAEYRGDASRLARALGGARPLLWGLIAGDTGMVLYFPDYSTHRGAAGVFVQDLWVAPEARGQGLGRRLLVGAMQAAARDWGAAYMTLMVEPSNVSAHAFYARLGFAPRPYGLLLAPADGITGVPE